MKGILSGLLALFLVVGVTAPIQANAGIGGMVVKTVPRLIGAAVKGFVKASIRKAPAFIMKAAKK